MVEPSASKAEFKEYADEHFQGIYGIHPDMIPLL
jgi:hypothetical protein